MTEYFETVQEVYRANSTWRIGQAHYEVMKANLPDLAHTICGGPFDPFYCSSEKEIPPMYFVWLAERLEACTV